MMTFTFILFVIIFAMLYGCMTRLSEINRRMRDIESLNHNLRRLIGEFERNKAPSASAELSDEDNKDGWDERSKTFESDMPGWLSDAETEPTAESGVSECPTATELEQALDSDVGSSAAIEGEPLGEAGVTRGETVIPPPSKSFTDMLPAAYREAVPPPFSASKKNMERLIGENIFSKAGILIFILGIGFFVKYAIDNNWINEVTRTILGMATGLGMCGIAYRLRESYRNFSSLLAGGGFAVSFVTIAIACNIYGIFSMAAAFVILVTLTVAMIVISLRFDRRELATVAIAGGFIAPFITAGPDGSVATLLGYVLILDVALIPVIFKRGWWELATFSSPLTWIVATIVLIKYDFTLQVQMSLLLSSTIYFALFSVLHVVALSRGDTYSRKLYIATLSMLFINNIAFFAISEATVADMAVMNRVKGAVPVIIAVVNGALYYRCSGNNEMIRRVLTALVIFPVALIFPLQFSSTFTVLSCFACYGALLNLAYALRREPLIGWGAFIMWILTAIGIMGIFAYDDDCRPWDGFATSLTCSIASLSSAWMVNRFKESYARDATIVYTSMLWFGALVLIMGLNLVYTSYWGEEVSSCGVMASGMAFMLAVSLLTSRGGNIGWLFPGAGAIWYGCSSIFPSGEHALAASCFLWVGAVIYVILAVSEGLKAFCRGDFRPLGVKAFTIYFNLAVTLFVAVATIYMLRETGLSRMYSTGLSVALAVSGAVQLIIGLKRRVKLMRCTGLGIMGIVLVKLIVHDLWQLPTIGRIIVFILLGIILLFISFLYQKLRPAILDD